jgi:hypothetical protein
MVTEPTPIKPTVLVVEDEMLLRMRAVDIVEDAGFTSLEAVNAEDALVLLESRSDIDLLFTDIQLPGAMNGLKLAHAVHALALNQDHFGVRSSYARRGGSTHGQPVLRKAGRSSAYNCGASRHDWSRLAGNYFVRHRRAPKRG